MPLDLQSRGNRSEAVTVSWDERDALLYAVSVGAGQDPLQELALTTENTEGVSPEALPSFGGVLAQRVLRPDIGPFDRAMLVHAEQRLTLHRPLPMSGKLVVTATVGDIFDKGSGAVVWTETSAVDPETGDPVVTSRSASFIRGEGGFGGERGTTDSWEPPRAEPDHVVTVRIRPEQALLYRLNGDRNPLHSDPAFAARGGFDRPILHGMCTCGFTCRALVGVVADGRPCALTAMGGRFSSPVWPGEELRIEIWKDGTDVWFRTLRENGVVALDRGCATVKGA
ncbi:MAG: MaoC/PaaZ C-terminal domain-containing protein [Microthrixaceae bacterium]